MEDEGDGNPRNRVGHVPIDAQVIRRRGLRYQLRRRQPLRRRPNQLRKRMPVQSSDVKVELRRGRRGVLHVEDEKTLRVGGIVRRMGGAGEVAEGGGGEEGEEEGEAGGESGAVAVDEGDKLWKEV